MKKILLGLVGLVLLTVSIAFAAPSLNWGTQLNPGMCDTSGKPVVNVVQKVINDVDSGQAGNYWAFDNYNRHIQVWPQAYPYIYCAVVKYEGKFDGQEDQTSPGNTGILSGEEDGTFEGGYRAIIHGELKDESSWSKKGFIGTFDYDCDITTGDCYGYVNWLEQYFLSEYGFDYDWWGWIYHGGKYGTWVNSADGNSGDIVQP